MYSFADGETGYRIQGGSLSLYGEEANPFSNGGNIFSSETFYGVPYS